MKNLRKIFILAEKGSLMKKTGSYSSFEVVWFACSVVIHPIHPILLAIE